MGRLGARRVVGGVCWPPRCPSRTVPVGGSPSVHPVRRAGLPLQPDRSRGPLPRPRHPHGDPSPPLPPQGDTPSGVQFLFPISSRWRLEGGKAPGEPRAGSWWGGTGRASGRAPQARPAIPDPRPRPCSCRRRRQALISLRRRLQGPRGAQTRASARAAADRKSVV